MNPSNQTCVIMQPTYFPWLGFFDLIDTADVFVLLDDVKLEKSTWQVRNRIKSLQSVHFITIPVSLPLGRMDTLIYQAKINPLHLNWKDKHLRSFQMAYGKKSNFNKVFTIFEKLLNQPSINLTDVTIPIIKTIAKEIGIKSKIIVASESLMHIKGEKDHRLVSICRELKCDKYLSTPGSADYLEVLSPGGAFGKSEVELLYHHYEHPIYPQTGDSFDSHLSIVDLLFNVGIDNALSIIRSGRRKSFTVEQMRALRGYV